MNRFKTIVMLLFAFIIGKPVNADNCCFKKDKDPWQVLMEVLAAHQVDTTGLEITSRLDIDSWEEINADLVKVYRVRKPVQIEKDDWLGSVVSAYMEEKYAKKRGEKYDYYKICYSPLIDDEYHSFMVKYPNSVYNRELESKGICVKQYFDWLSCMNDEHCHEVYRRYGESRCSYKGFLPLMEQNNKYRKTVEDWDALMLERNGNPDFDCNGYEVFISNHIGSLAGYNWVVYDSLRVCRQRQAWRAACDSHSIAGYRNYMNEYPQTKEANVAYRLIEDLTAWQQAVEANTHESYVYYYNEFPEGDSVVVAGERLKRIEEPYWQQAQKKNSITSYEQFVKRFPDGYYTAEALNRQLEMEIKKFNVKGNGTIDKLDLMGMSSKHGYSLLCFGNISKNDDAIMVSLIGNTPAKVTIKPSECQWVRVKNGEYRIYVTSKSGAEWSENGHGSITLEDGLYYQSWYSYVHLLNELVLSPELLELRYADAAATQKIDEEVDRRLVQEAEKLLAQKDIEAKRKVLTNMMRQYYELINDQEQYKQFVMDIQDDDSIDYVIMYLIDLLKSN